MSINFHCVMCAIRDNIYFISCYRGVIPSYAYKIQLQNMYYRLVYTKPFYTVNLYFVHAVNMMMCGPNCNIIENGKMRTLYQRGR